MTILTRAFDFGASPPSVLVRTDSLVGVVSLDLGVSRLALVGGYVTLQSSVVRHFLVHVLLGRVAVH